MSCFSNPLARAWESLREWKGDKLPCSYLTIYASSCVYDKVWDLTPIWLPNVWKYEVSQK